jgi:hypothetical protein
LPPHDDRRTTAARARDWMRRQFHAERPNRMWVAECV